MTRSFSVASVLACCALLPFAHATADDVAADAAADAAPAVSFYKQIRPIFQAHCQGCHQPARQNGAYVMTDFARMIQGGESESAAIVAHKPDESYLVQLITPTDGVAQMPREKPPLSTGEIELIRSWIAQGATDDTPENARQRFDMNNPPVYTRPPIVTSIDFSPDGSLLAIAGFHEVLLHKADGSGLVARLVGLSERIESVHFSPDSKRLAVAGGLPERMGELQIWDIEKKELSLSKPVTYDTVYGAAWSPDGKLIAVGCGDKTVRAFDSTSGEQVFFNGAHDDWALGTVFSVDGSQLVSVGRDMTTKLYEVGTQRFIDNVTSITPGALKGGITAIARHPGRDEVLVGGSDGVPRIYRMNRLTKRVIGDDANLIRQFPAMRGRIFSVDFAADGKRIVCASSLDGAGQIAIYSSDYDSTLTDELKVILEKLPGSWNAEERKKVEEFNVANISQVAGIDLPTGQFAVAFSPDGSTIVAAGAGGTVRFINPADGSITKEFVPVEVDPDAPRDERIELALQQAGGEQEYPTTEELPEGRSLQSLSVVPPVVQLNGPYDYAQLLVTGHLDNGDTTDLSRIAKYTLGSDVAKSSLAGQVQAEQDGLAALVISAGDHHIGVPVQVDGAQTEQPVSYVRDVMPVISKLGCNAGTCHGSKDGREGFKLSLRGYDPIFDVRAWTDDLKSRRVNLASPDDSLMLLKATGAVPHVGGQLTKPGTNYYELVRRWIAEGAQLDLDAPRVAGIEVQPLNPVIQQIGAKQQMRVIARYTDGTSRDVTAESFLESGNTDIAAVNSAGVVTTLRRGEAPVLARFEGAYAATTVTAMGDRTGFVWEQPETWSPIDELVAAKWERMKIAPSGVCSDAEFLRRVSLDLTGLPPSAEQVRAFMADDRPMRLKREELIDQLVGSEEYITYWTNKWADLLQVNSKYLGVPGANAFRDWIRQQLTANTPYDEFCRQVLTASGSNKENPAASYYKILREPDAMMENTTHLFLGVRFNCNKCHDHPFERWTQDQYYETAAFFARVGLKRDEAGGDANIGGTAVEGAKPLYEVVFEKPEGEITHDRTGAVTPPEFPYETQFEVEGEASRREQLAGWITSPDNHYFVESYVNRVWGYLLGVGLIEPLDDIRAGNPPSNPELMDWLSGEFVKSDFNVRELMKLICKSRTYQLAIDTNQWNQDDTINYSHARARRLPAEVLYDAVYTVTGSKMQIPGVPEGTRAAALADVATGLPDGFLANLGRPARESACECERSADLQLGPVMALMNGPTVSTAISQPGNAIEQLVSSEEDDAKVINELFVRILNRPARPEEIEATIKSREQLDEEHQQLVAELEQYKKDIAPEIAKREAKRQALIDQAKAELDRYKAEIAPAEAEKDQQQQAQVAKLTSELETYDKDSLQAALDKFEAEYQASITWVPLDPANLKSMAGVTLERQPDLSILAGGESTGRVEHTVVAVTNLRRITGIKIEALTEGSYRGLGPGLGPVSNFVLTELTAQWSEQKKGAKPAAIAFADAKATFSQENYDVKTAIDGKLERTNNGWAISPQVGKDQTAVFSLKEPLVRDAATRLTIKLDHRYQDDKHVLGHFRISVTDAADPLQFGVPREIDSILAIARGARTKEQSAALVAWFQQTYEERRQKELALAKAQQPRDIDPGIVQREATLADFSQPSPQDPGLARLERAVTLSEQQLGNARLTTAQDLAWALINSPAFLFNR
jgi:WD40 repeat protein/mono/diheme cytochrome c family protein